MATILSKNLRVKNGQIIKVQNDNRKAFSNEALTYYALWVSDEEFSDEYCIMLTEREFDVCDKLVGTFDNAFDFGKLYTISKVNSPCYGKRFLVRILHENSDETCLLIPEKKLISFKKRAEKNIEDQPEKGWLTNLFD